MRSGNWYEPDNMSKSWNKAWDDIRRSRMETDIRTDKVCRWKESKLMQMRMQREANENIRRKIYRINLIRQTELERSMLGSFCSLFSLSDEEWEEYTYIK